MAEEKAEEKIDRSMLLRGGSWYSFPRFCRSAYRYRNYPDCRYVSFGFRVVRVPKPFKKEQENTDASQR